ncbi:uncharacterized protein H6S33_009085 [Morchella sextelata]|uniref:uncharacterized protein n=1 Tax=Morchella sextelata TaxID=1174677 RepID=UPI001D0477DD|nr:uncharacterized protein H6S33_009085 [Morchella sextelata]KAH0612705.1 hypothetical protein H6S33_009085 [Morchella sextelata]
MKFGTKQVFLPNFSIGLLRKPHLPPNFVQFIVPLNLNKLDLKDYLYHAYGVECLSVRSYIEQQKIQYAKPHLMNKRLEWYRPRAIKKMTVELKEPFIYPEAPENLSPWGKDRVEQAEKTNREYQEGFSPDAKKKPSPVRSKLRDRMAYFESMQNNGKVQTETIEVEKELNV